MAAAQRTNGYNTYNTYNPVTGEATVGKSTFYLEPLEPLEHSYLHIKDISKIKNIYLELQSIMRAYQSKIIPERASNTNNNKKLLEKSTLQFNFVEVFLKQNIVFLDNILKNPMKDNLPYDFYNRINKIDYLLKNINQYANEVKDFNSFRKQELELNVKLNEIQITHLGGSFKKSRRRKNKNKKTKKLTSKQRKY